jgi:Leucine-rich repeat (LRR) protein
MDVPGVTWTNTNPKRISKINWYNISGSQELAGELNLEGCTALTELQIHYTKITAVNVSGCTALTELNCTFNRLTAVNASGCTALTELHCGDNRSNMSGIVYYPTLSTLDVSGCTALTTLTCNDNRVTSLNVSECTALTVLRCPNNQLTTLDLRNNTALKELRCYNNQFSTLDLGNNTALTSLECGSPLTDMTVGWSTPLQSILSATGDDKYLLLPNASTLQNATLHVPVGTRDLYAVATGWKDFGTILEMGETAPPQPPAPSYSLSVNPTSLDFPQTGSTLSVGVTANVEVSISKEPTDAA